MPELTKKQKKHLRELSNRCYEIEMSEALDEIYKDFEKWRNNEISVWKLNEKIHQHHNVASRNLYKFYVLSKDPINAAARGVSRGIIKLADIRDDCRPLLDRLIEYYEDK